MPEDSEITDPNAKKDASRKSIPINPPRQPSSEELWAAMNQQCSIAAGFSGGPPERDLVTQNNDKPPSEVKRMKKATEEPKK